MLKGIDISSYQGDVDFAAVKGGGIDFVFAKATEGVSFVDDRFKQYHDGCKEHGIPFGAYHFLRFNCNPVVQAQHFLQTIDSCHGDLLPMVDVEVTDGATASIITDRLSSFLNEVEKTLNGKRALLYTFYGFWNDTMQGSTSFSGHPLWIAEYNNDSAPTLPAGFKTFNLWQHSSQGHVPGIVGDVDEDVDFSSLSTITR